MKTTLIVGLVLIFSSCKNQIQDKTTLLEETLKKIENEASYYIALDAIDDCTCTITQKDGERVDTITKTIFWNELDKIDTLINHSSKSYISYYHFENGEGITISKLTPLDSTQSKKLPQLYKEIEQECKIFGFSHKSKASLKKAIKDLKQVALSCGASLK